VRVAAQRVRGEAPHAAVGRRRRALRRRGAAQARAPRGEGAEEGALARRVDGDHPGGRGAWHRARGRRGRRSSRLQQPCVPRWVGGGATSRLLASVAGLDSDLRGTIGREILR
jgi:hypothetical protein